MSAEQIALFEERLHKDRGLAETIWKLRDRKRFLDDYVVLATSEGFEFTATEAEAAGVLKRYERLFQLKCDPGSAVSCAYHSEGGLSTDVDGLLHINSKNRVDF